MEEEPDRTKLRAKAKKRLEGVTFLERCTGKYCTGRRAQHPSRGATHTERGAVKDPAELEASKARYFQLYDLAPVGYITLTSDLMIMEANLATSSLLGTERKASSIGACHHLFLPSPSN